MKRRLRKKKRLGEFQQLGFQLAFTLSPDADEEEMFDNFIDAIESVDLNFGGGAGDGTWDGFVASDLPRSSVTEQQHEFMKSWCQKEPLVLSYYLGPLVDAWHGDFDEAQMLGKWVTKSELA